jgi:Fe-S-cluster containining protein
MARFACDRKPGSCTRCGECCRFEPAKSLTPPEEESILSAIFRQTGFIYPYGLAAPGLDIQSYEYHRFQALSALKGIKIELRPKKVLYDAKRKLTIVFDWLLPCTECPFLKNKKECLIYEDRFDICRLFPSIEQKLPEVEKRHQVAAELIKSGELVMPSGERYSELCGLALSADKVNFDDFVEIKEFED